MKQIVLLALLCFLVSTARAQTPPDDEPDLSPMAVPRLLNYQVRLTEPDGAPLQGSVKMTFHVYAAAQGGALLWSETHNAVALVDGVASVLLGSLVTLPSDLFNINERYLGVSINDATELTPRMRVGAVPYALEAFHLDGKTAAEFEPKGAVLALAINDGTPPNAGTNRVHWNNLVGVPEGFVDGIDQGVTAHGDLTGLDADDHPQYALRTDLEASSGSGPNTGKNLVNWENLVGVPSGFADGADNSGAGVTVHADLLGLDADDHPQYATDEDLAEHAADMTLHGRTTDAGDLTSGFLSPDRIEAGSLDGSKIADGSLSAPDLEDESGIAYLTSTDEDSLEAVPQDLIMVTVDCPRPGWVLVVGTAQACVDMGETELTASFSVSDMTGVLHEPSTQRFGLTVDPGDVSCLPVTSQGVFPVTPGANTFYLVAAGDGAGIRASKPALSAVYLSTQY